jgi:hypothetical protein
MSMPFRICLDITSFAIACIMCAFHSFVLIWYKKMPQCWIYIQSLSRSCSVRSLVESGHVYQQISTKMYWARFWALNSSGHPDCQARQTGPHKDIYADVKKLPPPDQPWNRAETNFWNLARLAPVWTLRVCLHEHWFSCRDMSRDVARPNKNKSYPCVARRRAIWRDTILLFV